MNQNHDPNYDYEEIDLRDIFKTLNKWKNTIISVTLIAMLLSGVVSFFFLTPIYEAKTDLMQITSEASNGNLTSPNYILKDEEDYRKIEESALNISTPVIDLTSYNELVYSSIILKNTIEKLDLDIRARELRKMINAEKPKDQANVQITVTNQDPELAAQIANALAGELIIYINEMEQSSYNKVIKTVAMQIDNAQADLNAAVEKLKEYQASNIGINGEADLIKQELEAKKLQNEINRREDLIDFLNTKMLELKITQAFMDTEDKIITLSEAYVPDSPIKPNKKLNIAIAGVLALMLSVFGVFLAEYLREEEIN